MRKKPLKYECFCKKKIKGTFGWSFIHEWLPQWEMFDLADFLKQDALPDEPPKLQILKGLSHRKQQLLRCTLKSIFFYGLCCAIMGKAQRKCLGFNSVEFDLWCEVTYICTTNTDEGNRNSTCEDHERPQKLT